MEDFRLLDCISLEYDVPMHGLSKGDIGVVVDVREDGRYEVEFKIEEEQRRLNLLLLPEYMRGTGTNLL